MDWPFGLQAMSSGWTSPIRISRARQGLFGSGGGGLGLGLDLGADGAGGGGLLGAGGGRVGAELGERRGLAHRATRGSMTRTAITVDTAVATMSAARGSCGGAALSRPSSQALQERHFFAPSTMSALHTGQGTRSSGVRDVPVVTAHRITQATLARSESTSAIEPSGERRTRVGSARERQHLHRVGLEVDDADEARAVRGQRDDRLLAVGRDRHVGDARVERDVPDELALRRGRRPRSRGPRCSARARAGRGAPARSARARGRWGCAPPAAPRPRAATRAGRARPRRGARRSSPRRPGVISTLTGLPTMEARTRSCAEARRLGSKA